MEKVTKNLQEGEHIEYKAKAHWLGYLWALIWVGLGIYVMLHLKGLFVKLIFSKTQRMVIICVPFLLAAYKMVSCYLNIKKTKLFVTNKRVFARYGLLGTKKIDLEKNIIQGIFVYQPFWGKFLNFGTIYIVNRDVKQYSVKRIARPFEFLKQALTK